MSQEPPCFLLQVSLVADTHIKYHWRVLVEHVVKVTHNVMNLFFSLLTGNWLHRIQSGCQHKGNSVAYLNRWGVTSANQLKEPATWVYSVTQASAGGTLHSVPCWRSMLWLWLCALLMHTQKTLEHRDILMLVLNIWIICRICLLVFNGSVCKPAFFEGWPPKNEIWWKQRCIFHYWIPGRPDLRNWRECVTMAWRP